MGIISKISSPFLQTLKEVHTILGSGVVGTALLINHTFQSSGFLRTLTGITITIGSLMYVFHSYEKIETSRNLVVFVTGCDSGLGFSLIQYAHHLGFTVIAGFLSLESHGAKEIKRLYGNQIQQIELDVRKKEVVEAAVKKVHKFIESNWNYEFYGLINNAGVMVFGEFEWLTNKLIEQQIDVNLTGTFRVTKEFIPLLRKHKGRLVVVTSHCSEVTLPGLAVYGATKSGLRGWCDALRIELSKYGVKVIDVIPGSFVGQSNIMSNQKEYMNEMYDGFNQEQHLFYDDYFQDYYNYLLCVFSNKNKLPKKIDDDKLYDMFEQVLLSKFPKAYYKNENWRYKIYHMIIKFTPIYVRNYFILQFVQLPKYSPSSIDLGDI